MATVTSSKRQLTHTSNTYESNGDVTIGGNLNINGTTTTIDTANLLVEDKNIIIGDVSSPTDSTADGGGITLKGATDKTINWVNSTDSWTSNQKFSAPSLTLTGLTTSSETTALLINASNQVVKRTLGSNAFNSTSFLTGNQTITLSGDVSGSGTTSISVTVADDSHNHVISNVDGLQSALNGKLSTSGKAADSELLDGINSTSFARTDAADTFSQRIRFDNCSTNNHDNMAVSTQNLGGLEVFNSGSGNDAFMAFHTSSDYAVYFGLDADSNKLSVGGWSLGANKYEIYHSGNKPSLATLGYTGATNANYITNNNQLTNGANYITGNQTITLSGDVSGSGTTSISVTIADDSHNHIISNVDGLQSALDGKATAGDENIIDGAASIWNADGDGDVFDYNDSNPTHNGKSTGAVLNIRGDGTNDHSLVRAGIFTSNHVSTANGYYVGTLLGTSNSTTTQVINGSGEWTGSVIPAAKLSTATTQSSSENSTKIATTAYVKSQGYVTSSGNTVIGTDSDINTSGATVIDQLNMTDGVIQSHSTRTLTLANLGYTGATNANYITNNNQLTNGASYLTTSGKAADSQQLDGLDSLRFPYALNGTLGSTNTFVTDGGIGADNITRSMFYRDNGNQFGTIGFNAQHATSTGYSWQMASTSYSDASAIQARVKNNGTWSSPVTIWNSGNDGSGSGLDADTLDGLQLNSDDRNDSANVVCRTQGNGYAYFGWINTTSGNNSTTAISRIYASHDGFIRYYTPANFGAQIGSHISYNDLTNKPSIPSLSGYATESYVGTQISNLVNGAPAALDTLNELAAAIDDNASYAASITTALAGKQVAGTYNTIIGTDSDINTSGATVIDQLNMTDGVITSHSTRTITLANLGYTGATNANNYSLPLSSSSTRGGVKIGYTESGKNYPVELDSSEKMFVNVPWTDTNTDTNTTYSAGRGLDLSGTEFQLETDLRDSISYIGYDSNDYIQWSNNSSVRAVVAGTQRFIVGTSGIDVTGNATADTFRTDTNNVNYNLITRNHSSNTLYVQAAQSNSTQGIASFRYGSTAAAQGTEVLAVRRNSSYFANTKLGIGTTNPSTALDVSGTIHQTIYNATSLPSAYPAGQRAFAYSFYPLATSHGSVVSTNGSYVVPVYSDGSSWRAG